MSGDSIAIAKRFQTKKASEHQKWQERKMRNTVRKSVKRGMQHDRCVVGPVLVKPCHRHPLFDNTRLGRNRKLSVRATWGSR